jgi:hypothetical protein
MKPVKASQITSKAPPNCPTCGKPMPNYGGSAGYIHCGWKLLYRAGGWFGADGLHAKDDRLAGGSRRVDGHIRERA